MSFHHQADESLALRRSLGEKLFGRRENGFGIGLYFDLRDGFHRDGHALLGIEVLLGRDIERHQLERQSANGLNHRKDHGAVTLDDPGSAKAVDDERLMRSGFAVEFGKYGHQEQDGKNHQS